MVTWSELGGKSIVFFYWYLGVTFPTVLLIAKSWFVVSFYLYFTVVSFDLSRSRPYTYPSSTFRWFTFTSKARPQTFTQIWSYINLSQAFYPMPDTAFVFIYFQAAERPALDLAWCFRYLSSAIRQESLALSRAPEMFEEKVSEHCTGALWKRIFKVWVDYPTATCKC